MSKIRKIWKIIVVVTAYLYIPLIITLLFNGNAAEYADVPIEVTGGSIKGRKVNIVYNNAVQAVSLNDFVAMSVAKEYNKSGSQGSSSGSASNSNGVSGSSSGIADQEQMVKALAVVIRSDVVCQMNRRNEIDSDQLENGFLTRSQMKSKWGDDWKNVFTQIKQWVDETDNKIIQYKENYIRAMYTRVSPGKTMSGSRLLGEEYGYLAEVDCADDKESPDYMGTNEFDNSKLISIVRDWKKKTGMDCGIDVGNPSGDIQVTAKTDDGYITGMQVGDLCMSGEQFASMMGLKSAYLTLEYKKDSIRITSKGVGMGFGMSLYSANIMALDGCGYQEILKHFYPECIITSL